MKYDIEADWHLLDTCNYRCAYCFFPPEVLGNKLQTFATSSEWHAAFNSTGYRFLLHISGGEPTVYPHFAELCSRLTRDHYLSLNSNLSRPFDDFVRKVDPARVSFINAGYHSDERDRRSGRRIFLDNLDLLRRHNFNVLASLVGTPEALENYEDAIATLAPSGLFPIPKVQRGWFEGKKFPESYSQKDRERFRFYAVRAREHYASIISNWAERPTLDMLTDDKELTKEPSFTGKSCSAGYKFVRIDEKGEVFRCGTSISLGNVLNQTFERGPESGACDTSYCFYFCRKYAQKDFSIASRLGNWTQKLFPQLS